MFIAVEEMTSDIVAEMVTWLLINDERLLADLEAVPESEVSK